MREERRGGWCANAADTAPWLQVIRHFMNNVDLDVKTCSNQKKATEAGVAHSVERLSCHMLCLRQLDSELKPHHFLYVCKYIGHKLLSCHAGPQEVSRCHTRGESEKSITCRRGSIQASGSPLF